MRVTTLPSALTFEGTQISIIDRDGQPWITAADLAQALGYSRRDAVTKIHDRNASEFTSDMTLTPNLGVKHFGAGESEKPVRIFSPRGAHLVAMFARTERAAAFRRWVLDVLEGFAAPPAPPADPASILAGSRAYLNWVEAARQAMVSAGVQSPAWPQAARMGDAAHHAALASLLVHQRWLLSVDDHLGLHLAPVPPGAAVLSDDQIPQWVRGLPAARLPELVSAIGQRLGRDIRGK